MSAQYWSGGVAEESLERGARRVDVEGQTGMSGGVVDQSAAGSRGLERERRGRADARCDQERQPGERGRETVVHMPGEDGGDRLAAEHGLELGAGAEQPLIQHGVVQLEW